MTDVIVVIGKRLPSGSALWYSYLPPDEPVQPDGSEIGINDGSGGEVWEEPNFDEALVTTCTSESGAAHRIAQKIKSTTNSGSPNNWTKHEYGAVIVSGANGTFKPYLNKITTNQQPKYVAVSIPAETGTIEGLIHNHALEDTLAENLDARYPSDDDWDRVNGLVQEGRFPPSITLYILDPMGETRAFSYSDMAAYRNQTPQQRQAGDGLPASVAAGSCTDLGE